MESEVEMTFGNRLALDRTYLAKERTILAYIRTGLALVGLNLVIYEFIEVDLILIFFLSLLSGIPGLIILMYGFYKISIRHREREELEKHFITMGKKDIE